MTRSARFLPLAMIGFAAHAAASPPYAVSGRVALGAPDRWDYVTADPAEGRVYAAHGDRFTAIDTRDLRVVGDVAVGAGAHGVAIVPRLHRGFASNGETARVTVFDTRTLKTAATIPVGKDADDVVFDPAHGGVWVICGDIGRVDAIDPDTNAVSAKVDVGGGLEAGTPDGQGRLFVNGAERREVVVIDTQRAAVVARWPVPDCVSPHGLAYDPVSARVFTTCVDGQMFALDTRDGHIAEHVAIGKGSDAAAVDVAGRRVLSANGDGTLSVFAIGEGGALRAEPEVTTPPGTRTLAVETAEHGAGRVFLLSAAHTDAPPRITEGGGPRYAFKPGSVEVLVLSPGP